MARKTIATVEKALEEMTKAKNAMLDEMVRKDQRNEKLLSDNRKFITKITILQKDLNTAQIMHSRGMGLYNAMKTENMTLLKSSMRASGMEWQDIERVIGERGQYEYPVLPTLSSTDGTAGIILNGDDGGGAFVRKEGRCDCPECRNARRGNNC